MLRELAENWRVLLGCILGIAVGVVAMPTAALAIFMPALEAEFGWSRAGISLAGSILVGMLVLTSPLIGWIADRTSETRMILISLGALVVSFLLFSRMSGDLRLLLFGFGAMALTASGASTIPFARIISTHFSAARGIALGLAMSGTGLSAILLPLILVPFVAANGWRAGFIVLATITACAIPVVGILMRSAGTERAPSTSASAIAQSGRSTGAALRSREFALLASGFGLVSIASAGLSIHFVAMLGDAGLSPVRAGAIASLAGASVIFVRVMTGWMIDRMFAPHVAAAMMFAAAACLISLAAGGIAAAPLGALAYGLAVGSEIDILAYLTARYFGMRAYGRIYGALYMALLAGAAISPLGYGIGVDLTGSYRIPLTAAAILLAIAAILFLALPRFPDLSGASRAIPNPIPSDEGATDAEPCSGSDRPAAA